MTPCSHHSALGFMNSLPEVMWVEQSPRHWGDALPCRSSPECLCIHSWLKHRVGSSRSLDSCSLLIGNISSTKRAAQRLPRWGCLCVKVGRVVWAAALPTSCQGLPALDQIELAEHRHFIIGCLSNKQVFNLFYYTNCSKGRVSFKMLCNYLFPCEYYESYQRIKPDLALL